MIHNCQNGPKRKNSLLEKISLMAPNLTFRKLQRRKILQEIFDLKSCHQK